MKTGITMKRSFAALLVMFFFFSATEVAFAKESTFNVPGAVFEFSDSEKYPISTATAVGPTTTSNTMGNLSVSGSINESGLEKGVQTYVVTSGNIDLSYDFDSSILNAGPTDWHLIDDNSSKVDNITLRKNILSGAVLVQSSKDGETWITDAQCSDAFNSEDTLKESFYSTKDIQLENGCYYRVIIVYELQVKTGEEKSWFWTTDINETKRVAEVYEFYAIYGEMINNTTSAADSPRKEIARKPKNTGKDNGFSGEEIIDKDDPHFGWELGSFIINGYTREANYNGSPVYLKNVGDKVTLWFTLDQDINCLNGHNNLMISEDTNGYDLEFGVSQTNFGHGALIISYTDYEGKTHDPIIYTDFLMASAKTGADTKVQLFEEGDYKVSLDYEIFNNPYTTRLKSILPEFTNYKITFAFSIRNGNCMVYPFDIENGNELSDNSITSNGFKLDMARSRYLNIDVTRTVLNVGSDGFVSEDIRFNRPAKDSDSYTDEGIYTFTVTNLYTGSTINKTLYVGTDRYLRALSKNVLTVGELNKMISEGYIIESDGTLTEQIVETEPEILNEVNTESESESISEISLEPEPDVTAEETETAEEVDLTEQEEQNEMIEEKTEEIVEETAEEGAVTVQAENEKSISPLPFVIFGLVVAGGAFLVITKMKKGNL